MAGPKFSILIPTRNGIKYLPYAIDSVLSQSATDFELVVSDNHSTDGTADYLATVTDPRFRRIQPPTLLSMVDHFEFILGEATGDWITSLGDDDGILPFFFERLQRIDLETLGADALVFRRAYYFWAGCEELYGGQVVAYHPAGRVRRHGNRLAMFLCLASVVDYMHLPQLYTTGLVKKTYVDKIKAATGGRFFYGRSPDASSAAALALHAPRHCRFEQPLFWTGTSPKSTGFSGGSDVQKSRIAEFDQLNRQASVAVPETLPAAIRSLFDLSVIFYEALLANPAAPRFWSGRLARNIFLAGLILKNRGNLNVIRDAYGPSIGAFELNASVVAVRILAFAVKMTRYKTSTSDASASLYSEDRSRYPTMTEAAAGIRAIYDGTLAGQR